MLSEIHLLRYLIRELERVENVKCLIHCMTHLISLLYFLSLKILFLFPGLNT